MNKYFAKTFSFYYVKTSKCESYKQMVFWIFNGLSVQKDSEVKILRSAVLNFSKFFYDQHFLNRSQPMLICQILFL